MAVFMRDTAKIDGLEGINSLSFPPVGGRAPTENQSETGTPQTRYHTPIVTEDTGLQ